MPPISHGFMADFDDAFVKQIFHVAERQRETNIEHHCQADNLAARFEVTKWGQFRHPAKLRNRPACLKLVLSDSAPGRAQGGQVGCSALAVARQQPGSRLFVRHKLSKAGIEKVDLGWR